MGLVSNIVLLLLCIAVAHAVELNDCIERCKLAQTHNVHCQTSCEYVSKLDNAQVFVDGVKIEPSNDILSDNIYTSKQIHFDKNFYNTPAAFEEIIDFKGELLDKFYAAAAKVFVTPGAKYTANTKLHILPVPIPLTDSQFNNQGFMNKLLDVVPSESSEYKTASVLSLSEAYVDFLTSIKVDPAVVDDAPKAPEVRAKIQQMEANLETILNAFVSLETKCFDAYNIHIVTKGLSPISYTMETFRGTNNNCKMADAKLDQHAKATEQLSNYLTNLNPYNRLFEAIGRTKSSSFDWNYAKSDIQQFATFHRDMEAKRVVPAASQYSIPIDITRNFFNHLYLGAQTKFVEKDLKAQLSFSGLGWKETAISPSTTWFDVRMIHRYRASPTNSKKLFFGLNGSLNRIPTHMVIAYKPQMKMRISRTTKEVIAGKAATQGLRPVNAGSMVFTNIDIRTVDGGAVNEEFELVLSTNVKDPQIIGVKSNPIVNIPSVPASPPAKYLQFVDKQVSLRTPSNSFICTRNGKLLTMNKNECPSESHKWIVHNVGEGKVALMSIHGTFLSVSSNNAMQLVHAMSENEKFTMLESGANWQLRSAHGSFLTGTALTPNPYKKYSVYKSAYQRSLQNDDDRFHNNYFGQLYLKSLEPDVGQVQMSAAKQDLGVTVEPASAFFRYYNKKVYIKNAHGMYLRAHSGGQGAKIDTSSTKGPAEQWRVVYGGDHKIGLLSNFGTYLRSKKPNMSIFYFLSRQRRDDNGWHYGDRPMTNPETIDLETQMGSCEMLQLVPRNVAANQFVLQGGCHSAFLKTKAAGVGQQLQTSDKAEEIFTIELA